MHKSLKNSGHTKVESNQQTHNGSKFRRFLLLQAPLLKAAFITSSSHLASDVTKQLRY